MYAWEDGSIEPQRRVCLDATRQLQVTATDSAVMADEFGSGAQRATASVTAEVLDCGRPDELCVRNPSFEGTPGLGDFGLMLPEWTICELTPDVNPGTQLASLPASDGATYLGIGAGLGIMESAGGRFCAPLEPGVPVALTVDVSTEQEPFGTVQVWGASAECGKDELLMSAGITASREWQTRCATFTPTRAVTHLLLTTDMGYALVDNLRNRQALRLKVRP